MGCAGLWEASFLQNVLFTPILVQPSQPALSTCPWDNVIPGDAIRDAESASGRRDSLWQGRWLFYQHVESHN